MYKTCAPSCRADSVLVADDPTETEEAGLQTSQLPIATGLRCQKSFPLLRLCPKPVPLEFPVLAPSIVASAILIKSPFDLSVRLH